MIATSSRACAVSKARHVGRRPVHVLGDGQLGDLVAEQGEFGLDAAAAPGGVFARHASDEVAKLGGELRAADRVRPGLPPPAELETSAVPREHRRRLDDDETGSPARPDPAQPDPEHPVPPREAGSATGALEDPELMAEREVLEGDGRRPEEPGAEKRPDTDHKQHGVTSASGMASEPKLYRISDGGDEVSSGGTK